MPATSIVGTELASANTRSNGAIAMLTDWSTPIAGRQKRQRNLFAMVPTRKRQIFGRGPIFALGGSRGRSQIRRGRRARAGMSIELAQWRLALPAGRARAADLSKGGFDADECLYRSRPKIFRRRMRRLRQAYCARTGADARRAVAGEIFRAAGDVPALPLEPDLFAGADLKALRQWRTRPFAA